MTDLQLLLQLVRKTIRHHLDIGLLSRFPQDEDPEHDFGELLPHIDDAIGPAKRGTK